MSVRMSVWVCVTYVVHHSKGTELQDTNGNGYSILVPERGRNGKFRRPHLPYFYNYGRGVGEIFHSAPQELKWNRPKME